MKGRKFFIGIAVFLGIVLVCGIYYVVASDRSQLHGSVQINSEMVSWQNGIQTGIPNGTVLVCGYQLQKEHAQGKHMLPTKSHCDGQKTKFQFPVNAQSQYLIVMYLQLDQLTGELGQTQELRFVAEIPPKGKRECSFDIQYKMKNGKRNIEIAFAGLDHQKPLTFSYPEGEVPALIQL